MMATDPSSRRAGAIPGAAAAVALVVALTACGDDTGPAASRASTAAAAATTAAVIDPGDGGRYVPTIDPAAFVDLIDNPYLPLQPGTRWVYRSTTAEGDVETITVEVTDERREVMGVSTAVVHDVVTVDGEIIEDTYDWYAQDDGGNVWYFGEATTAYDGGQSTTAGSWEAGVDGAQPGIVMLADPAVSDTGYRQEYDAGEAEDMGQVIAVGERVVLDIGTFDDVVVTRDWTPLEPDVIEEKFFAPGVGLVRETTSDGEEGVLVEFAPGV